ncbi:MAG: hypothetical protein QM724_09750 [Flavobacteriales bacterium]
MAVEEQFYLIWPFLMMRLSRKGLIRMALLLIAIAIAAVFILPGIVLHFNGRAYPLPVLSGCSRWFLPAAGPILVGALASIIVQSHPLSTKRFVCSARCLFMAAALFATPLFLPGPMLRMAFILQAAGVALLLMRILERQRSPLTNVLEWAR